MQQYNENNMTLRTESVVLSRCFSQMYMFLNHLNEQSIGVSVLGIFVIDKNTILAVYTIVYFYCSSVMM